MEASPNVVEYQVGGSLTASASSYITRQVDTDFYAKLKAGEFCYVFNSRQMGKSSLVVRTMERLRKDGVVCAPISLQAFGTNLTLSQWYASLLYNLASNFALETDFYSWFDARYERLSPLQCLSEFIDTILLAEVTENIVVFIDEIDLIRSLDFPVDDFLSLIRTCYNNRADKPQFKRLTFALIGVATPSTLIRDKKRTPFNIGKSVQLTGFTTKEALTLALGLAGKVENYEVVMDEVISWTGGQPFLTQRVCKLLLTEETSPDLGTEAKWVEQVVRAKVIENWESQDEQEHLKTISRRILDNELRAVQRLGIYREILQQGSITAIDSSEQMDMRLSGLVVKQQSRESNSPSLKVYNRIYQTIFDLVWVDTSLSDLRPYAEAIARWEASGCQDDSRLLRDKALLDAKVWSANRNLSELDYRFLTASEELGNHEAQLSLEIQKEVNQKLSDGQKKAGRIIRRGILGFMATTVLAVAIIVWAELSNQRLKSIETTNQLTSRALPQFASGQSLEALTSVIKATQIYKSLNLQKLKEVNQKTQNSLDSETSSVIPILPESILRGILAFIREKNIFRGHELSVTSLNFSPDGKYLISGGEEGIAILWDLTGKEIARFKGHKGIIRDVTFNPDSQHIATAGDDGTVRIWDNSGKQLKQIDVHKERVWSVSFSPNGKYLLATGDSGTVKLWDTSGKEIATMKGHEGVVLCSSFSPDGQMMATAGQDGLIMLWDLSGKRLKVFKDFDEALFETRIRSSISGGYRQWLEKDRTERKKERQTTRIINGIQFSPDGQRLATVRDDGQTQVWNVSGEKNDADFLRPKQEFGSYKFDGKEELNGLSYSPDGKQVAVANAKGSFYIWDVTKKPSSVTTIDIKSGNSTHPSLLINQKAGNLAINNIRYSPDSKYLATAGEDGTIRIWDLGVKQHGKWNEEKGWLTIGTTRLISFKPDRTKLGWVDQNGFIFTFNTLAGGEGEKTWQPHNGGVQNFDFSSDSKYLVTIGSDRKAIVWSYPLPWDKKKQQLSTLTTGNNSFFTQAVFSADSKDVVLLKSDNTVIIWNWSTGKQIATLSGHTGGILGIHTSPTAQVIATTGSDGIVRLWNFAGKEVTQLKGHKEQQGIILLFSLDGKQIITLDADGKICVWDLTGKLLAQWQSNEGKATGIFFTPNNSVATAQDNGTVKLWDLSGKLLLSISAFERKVTWVDFSPDGKNIVTVGESDLVKIWDISGKLKFELKGHKGWLSWVGYSSDSQRIYSADTNGIVKAWNAQGKEIGLKPAAPESSDLFYPSIVDTTPVTTAIFTSDGQQIITAAMDGTVRMWDLSMKQTNLFFAQPTINSMAVSPNGLQIATVGANGNAYLWDKNGKFLVQFVGSNSSINSIAFSPDGSKVVIAGSDGIGRLFDLSGTLLAEFKGHQKPINNIGFSPDGTRVATVSDDESIKIWDLTGKLIQTWQGKQGFLKSMRFSPAGQYIATGGINGSIKLWDLTGKEIKEFFHIMPKGVYSIDFSPDGNYLAAAGFEGDLGVWNLSGQLILERFNGKNGNLDSNGHIGQIYSVRFSPDGTRLITASNDGTVRMWKMESLDSLIIQGCQWLQDYLKNNPQKSEICPNF
jgi:WD40 repeat protein